MITKQRLEQLINETHKHAEKLKVEIAHLEASRPLAWRLRIKTKRKVLVNLEALNARRRKELVSPGRFTMFDDTTIETIPADAVAVAGYVNGAWPTFTKLVAKFPNAKHASIAVNSSADADFLDVENGDATPADVPAWIARQKKLSKKLIGIYASLDTWPEIFAILKQSHIDSSSIKKWVADYTGSSHIPVGFDACQWTDSYDGKSLDASWCLPNFLEP